MEKTMSSMNSAFNCVYGSGYLILDDGSSPMVGYKVILDLDDFSGGGFLLGLNEKDSFKVAQLQTVRLDIGDKFLALLVGRYDGDALPIVVLGLTTGPDKVH
jgi:hypothetical protein